MPVPASDAVPIVAARPDLLACEECDALYRRVPLASGQQARCGRCGNLLGRGHRMSLQAMLALTLAALVVYLIANLQPVVQLNLGGVRNSATLPGALADTWASGEHAVALLAGAVAFVFPGAVILLRLYALLPVLTRRLPPHWPLAMRALAFASRWSMVEVLMLSAMVSIVRIAGMASVQPGVGLFGFGTLALLLAALETAGQFRLWQLAELR
ncbi:paraquat-inducible protein A [Ideonella sp. BN130291]|uniref:paraquat-inducible protein A n=1 Tax=Ideonella sp. BN130291 TaxID=3112940 RepID=UPI002E2579A7|nr:paraquat-inducible protein A [Ideonella sp. BN130291]